MQLADLFALYMAWARPRLKDPVRRERILSRWAAFFPDRTADSIRRADIARWIVARQAAGRATNTINNDLVALSAVYTYATRILELELRNPAACQFLKPPEGRVRYLSIAEAAAVVACARTRQSPRLAPFIVLALNTGCRSSELTGLSWSEVDIEGRRITLDGARTKTKRRRVIPINQSALAALAELRDFHDRHCPASPWVFCTQDGRPVRKLSASLSRVYAAAGVQDFRSHDLRHTFASWLVLRDVSLYKVRDLLGHATIKMTERYAHLASDTLARAVAVLDAR